MAQGGSLLYCRKEHSLTKVLNRKLILLLLVFLGTFSLRGFGDDLKKIEEENKNKASITADLRVDSNRVTEFNLDGDFSFQTGTRMSAGFGRTQGHTDDGAPDSLDTRELRLGIKSDPEEKWSYGFNYDLWGQAGQITTNTLGTNLDYACESWFFSFYPQLRFISFFLADGAPVRRRFGGDTASTVIVRDPSLGASIKYWGLRNWHFRLHGSYYFYSESMADLNSQEISKFFSSSATVLSQSFLRVGYGGEAGYKFEEVFLAASAFHSISEIDNSPLTTCEIRSTFYYLKDLDVEMMVGLTPLTTGNLKFVGMGITHEF